MFSQIAFYVFAVLVLSSFLIVVTTQNILYALSALAFGMIMVSGFFFLLGADFLGVVQITVYTGAVVALYAFGMMFFELDSQVNEKHQNRFNLFVIMALLCIVLFVIISWAISLKYPSQDITPFDTKDIAQSLFNDYLVHFEVAAIMLLMAMVAGISIGIRKSYMTRNIKKKDE